VDPVLAYPTAYRYDDFARDGLDCPRKMVPLLTNGNTGNVLTEMHS
jgi:hypothetical protein